MNFVLNSLTDEQKKILLALARQSIQLAVNDLPPLHLNMDAYEPPLNENGASFVTLTIHGNLRGCIGTLAPYQTLVEDVYEHAAAAAMNDYRFYPLKADELDETHIEISRLTLPRRLDYQNPVDLPSLLKPGVDGVIIRDGARRATFLPQVWEQLPVASDFLTHLCQKMGASGSLWSQRLLEVEIYEVEEFKEE
jgi:uncharacterized protein